MLESSRIQPLLAFWVFRAMDAVLELKFNGLDRSLDAGVCESKTVTSEKNEECIDNIPGGIMALPTNEVMAGSDRGPAEKTSRAGTLPDSSGAAPMPTKREPTREAQ